MNQIVLPGTEMVAELSIDLSMAEDDADIDQRALMELLTPLEQHLTVLIEFANHSKAARHEHLPFTIGFLLSLNRWRTKLFLEVIVTGLNALLRRDRSTQLCVERSAMRVRRPRPRKQCETSDCQGTRGSKHGIRHMDSVSEPDVPAPLTLDLFGRIIFSRGGPMRAPEPLPRGKASTGCTVNTVSIR